MGTKLNPGSYDCYANAAADEPMFILLARDPHAPLAVERWADDRELLIKLGAKPESDQAMVEEARECAKAMRDWRLTCLASRPEGTGAISTNAKEWEALSREIFVFGSNLAGIHGAGAALYALQHHGAVYGRGIGLQGDSYGIPTKDEDIRTLPLDRIRKHVDDFLEFARQRPDLNFIVTAIGTGLAGYKHADIAPMFRGAPVNCILPDEWAEWRNA